MSCSYNKHMCLALSFVIYEFEASTKCKVSLVVKYKIWHKLGSFCETMAFKIR